MLDSLSYRSALDRGFAVVRGSDGAIRRRADGVLAGEHLTLTFADGERGATADAGKGGAHPAKPAPRPAKPGKGQGTLF